MLKFLIFFFNAASDEVTDFAARQTRLDELITSLESVKSTVLIHLQTSSSIGSMKSILNSLNVAATQ